MSKSCAYVLRVCIVVLTAAALAFAILACFFPLYTTGPSAGRTTSSVRVHDSAAARGTMSQMAASLVPSLDVSGYLKTFESQSIDLFNYKATVASTGSTTTGSVSMHEEKWTLRTRYFSCYMGRKLIQAAEGAAVVACVLCCANFVLSVFLFWFQPVVRVPLCVYAFLAAAAEAASLGLVLHLYLNGWCPDMDPMNERGLWSPKIGVFMMIVSCAASTITCVLALVLSCCR